MRMGANEWLVLALYVGTCWNVWLAYRYRNAARSLVDKANAVSLKWNAAVKEAEELWKYGAREEALALIREASELK